MRKQGLKYLGAKNTGNNEWNIEIGNRINKAEMAYCLLIKYFKLKLISKGTTIRLNVSIVRPTIIYGFRSTYARVKQKIKEL